MTEPSNDSILLLQAVREFLDWQALDKGRSPNTVRAYLQDLSKFVAYCAAHDVTTLAEVDRAHLDHADQWAARAAKFDTANDVRNALIL